MVTNQKYDTCKRIMDNTDLFSVAEVKEAADYICAFNEGYQAACKSTLTKL